MSNRHVHITSFLYADPDRGALGRFETVARQHFESVTPVRVSVKAWDHADPDVLVLYSKDGGNGDDWIYTLPRAVEALSGIFERDVEIVSAWEGAEVPGRPRVWHVAGRGRPPAAASAAPVYHGFAVPSAVPAGIRVPFDPAGDRLP